MPKSEYGPQYDVFPGLLAVCGTSQSMFDRAQSPFDHGTETSCFKTDENKSRVLSQDKELMYCKRCAYCSSSCIDLIADSLALV
jgi:hypothetical protein